MPPPLPLVSPAINWQKDIPALLRHLYQQQGSRGFTSAASTGTSTATASAASSNSQVVVITDSEDEAEEDTDDDALPPVVQLLAVSIHEFRYYTTFGGVAICDDGLPAGDYSATFYARPENLPLQPITASAAGASSSSSSSSSSSGFAADFESALSVETAPHMPVIERAFADIPSFAVPTDADGAPLPVPYLAELSVPVVLPESKNKRASDYEFLELFVGPTEGDAPFKLQRRVGPVLQRRVGPVLRALSEFAPHTIILADGKDAIANDQLGNQGLMPETYAQVLSHITRACPRASILGSAEGGYGSVHESTAFIQMGDSYRCTFQGQNAHAQGALAGSPSAPASTSAGAGAGTGSSTATSASAAAAKEAAAFVTDSARKMAEARRFLAERLAKRRQHAASAAATPTSFSLESAAADDQALAALDDTPLVPPDSEDAATAQSPASTGIIVTTSRPRHRTQDRRNAFVGTGSYNDHGRGQDDDDEEDWEEEPEADNSHHPRQQDAAVHASAESDSLAFPGSDIRDARGKRHRLLTTMMMLRRLPHPLRTPGLHLAGCMMPHHWQTTQEKVVAPRHPHRQLPLIPLAVALRH